MPPTPTRSPGWPGEAVRLRRSGRTAGAPGARRRLHLHAQRRPHGAGGPGRPGGQARRGRKAPGDHPAAVRRDHRGLRRRRRPALHHLPVAVHAGQPPAQGGDRPGAVRPLDPGRHLRQVVADPGVLRLRRLARDLAARRRRRAHEPGDSQRRPALLADGRRRHDHGARRPRWPTSASRSKTRPSPPCDSRTERSESSKRPRALIPAS